MASEAAFRGTLEKTISGGNMVKAMYKESNCPGGLIIEKGISTHSFLYTIGTK